MIGFRGQMNMVGLMLYLKENMDVLQLKEKL